MSKHTLGPWVGKKDGVYFDTPWSIDHEDGHDASWAAISTPKGRTLALVVNDDSKRPMDFQSEEMHANAQLISAAPDLLEALIEVAASLAWNAHGECRGINDGPIMPSNGAVEMARAAIAKARGES